MAFTYWNSTDVSGAAKFGRKIFSVTELFQGKERTATAAFR
jgi:hypothetical protein